ncbi:MAG TPA: exosortase K [Pyrinomonadaceae bacterium]|nr:exosortase K [Pyrinomonadaceae bacterium]
MIQRFNWLRNVQLVAVLLCAALIKFYYSTTSVNQLRWILAPTATLVELLTGTHFEFESHAGYMSGDHTFLIAASCAGVNFLITAFLMLSLRKLWQDRGKVTRWSFIASAAALAYFATLLANTARISLALQLRRTPLDIGLSPDQLHRLEGIVVYFGFLLVLFVVSERFGFARVASIDEPVIPETSGWFSSLRHSLFPLLVYYAITLGAPLANGAYRKGTDFWEHSVFVLVTPLLLVVPVMGLQFVLRRRLGSRHPACNERRARTALFF